MFSQCKCTNEYNVEIEGKKVEAHCAKWETGDEKKWCYIDKGLKGEKCEGATKSTKGDFYWSSHEKVCNKGK